MSPRPMRRYQPGALACPVCGKQIRPNEPTRFVDGEYRHAVLCTAPLRRSPKPRAAT